MTPHRFISFIKSRFFYPVFWLILFTFAVSCKESKKFEREFKRQIESADRIEVIAHRKSEKKVSISDSTALANVKSYLLDLLPVEKLEKIDTVKITAFPYEIFLYKGSTRLGQLGIDVRERSGIFYKLDKKFEYKTGLNYQLGRFLQEL